MGGPSKHGTSSRGRIILLILLIVSSLASISGACPSTPCLAAPSTSCRPPHVLRHSQDPPRSLLPLHRWLRWSLISLAFRAMFFSAHFQLIVISSNSFSTP